MSVALRPDILQKMHAYWRTAIYLSVGQIYLQDNFLLESPLTLEHIKLQLLGHWGTTPGLNLLFVHFSRLIEENDLDMIYVIGPGHPPALAAWVRIRMPTAATFCSRYPCRTSMTTPSP